MHRWGWAPGFGAAVWQHLGGRDIAYLNGILTYPATVAGMVLRDRGIPFVAATRGGMRAQALARGRVRKRIFFRLWTIPTLREAACIHATSEAEAREYEAFALGRPVTIIPNGIDPGAYETSRDAGDIEDLFPGIAGRRVVLFVGRISPEKGLKNLLRAWKLLGRGTDDAVLVIAGPDDRRHLSQVRAEARSLGVSNVLFTGMVRGWRKVALYRRALFLVLPSRTENFGNVVVESLACGRPVIASRGTPWRLLEEVGAGYWVPGDPGSLSEAMRAMLRMPGSTLDDMGEKGREVVLRDYTWDAAAQKMIAVYRCILEGSEIPRFPSAGEGDVEKILQEVKGS